MGYDEWILKFVKDFLDPNTLFIKEIYRTNEITNWSFKNNVLISIEHCSADTLQGSYSLLRFKSQSDLAHFKLTWSDQEILLDLSGNYSQIKSELEQKANLLEQILEFEREILGSEKERYG